MRITGQQAGRRFSKDARVRRKQEKMLDVYAEQVGSIGGDPERDRAAMVVAVERSGIDHRLTTNKAKVSKFLRLWKSDEARAYVCELWGMAVEEDPDPVSLAMKMLHTHVVQDDERWGPRDRGVSLSAVKEMLRVFVPAQTTKVATLNVSARVDRPQEFSSEPVMKSRTILPAGQRIARPVDAGDVGEDDDEG